jgi:hypothetical protein
MSDIRAILANRLSSESNLIDLKPKHHRTADAFLQSST